jgi:hypothetical protein
MENIQKARKQSLALSFSSFITNKSMLSPLLHSVFMSPCRRMAFARSSQTNFIQRGLLSSVMVGNLGRLNGFARVFRKRKYFLTGKIHGANIVPPFKLLSSLFCGKRGH